MEYIQLLNTLTWPGALAFAALCATIAVVFYTLLK